MLAQHHMVKMKQIADLWDQINIAVNKRRHIKHNIYVNTLD